MLAYFKNYRMISFAISFLAPLAVIGLVSLFMGLNLMTGISGGLLYLACMLVLLGITGNFFGKRAEEEAEAALAQYNEHCDPMGFRDMGKKTATAVYEECYQKCTTELGAWYLAPFALACADTDAAEDAEMMERMLLERIPADATAQQRAGILINIEPLTLRLHGPEAALLLAREAATLLEGDDTPEASTKKSFLGFEIPLLEALLAGDANTLAPMFTSVVNNDSNPLRIRVLDSDALGGINTALGNVDAARDNYQFVIDNGNKLPVAQEARLKLAAL